MMLSLKTDSIHNLFSQLLKRAAFTYGFSKNPQNFGFQGILRQTKKRFLFLFFLLKIPFDKETQRENNLSILWHVYQVVAGGHSLIFLEEKNAPASEAKRHNQSSKKFWGLFFQRRRNREKIPGSRQTLSSLRPAHCIFWLHCYQI